MSVLRTFGNILPVARFAIVDGGHLTAGISGSRSTRSITDAGGCGGGPGSVRLGSSHRGGFLVTFGHSDRLDSRSVSLSHDPGGGRLAGPAPTATASPAATVPP